MTRRDLLSLRLPFFPKRWKPEKLSELGPPPQVEDFWKYDEDTGPIANTISGPLHGPPRNFDPEAKP